MLQVKRYAIAFADKAKAREVFEGLKSLDTSGLGGVLTTSPPYFADSGSLTGRLSNPKLRTQNLPISRPKPKPQRPRRVVVSLLDTQLIADEEKNIPAVEWVRRELDPTPSKIQAKLDCAVGDTLRALLYDPRSRVVSQFFGPASHTGMLKVAVERARGWAKP